MQTQYLKIEDLPSTIFIGFKCRVACYLEFNLNDHNYYTHDYHDRKTTSHIKSRLDQVIGSCNSRVPEAEYVTNSFSIYDGIVTISKEDLFDLLKNSIFGSEFFHLSSKLTFATKPIWFKQAGQSHALANGSSTYSQQMTSAQLRMSLYPHQPAQSLEANPQPNIQSTQQPAHTNVNLLQAAQIQQPIPSNRPSINNVPPRKEQPVNYSQPQLFFSFLEDTVAFPSDEREALTEIWLRGSYGK